MSTDPYTAPRPEQLPDIRLRLMRHYQDPTTANVLGMATTSGRATLIPDTGTHDSDTIGAALTHAEHRRLAHAHLYYATSDMTALAVAAASQTPRHPVSASTPPSPYGFMVFADPIGSYEHKTQDETPLPGVRTTADAPNIHIPIVAVSWGPWTDPAHTRYPIWAHNDPTGPALVECGPKGGIWITFYTVNEVRYDNIDPDTVLGYMHGAPVTVAAMQETLSTIGGPMSWENETVLIEGAPWVAPTEGTTQMWVQAVYTAWQLMAQSSRLTETTPVPRARHGRKRDQRAHASVGEVHLIDVHSSHRPRPADTEADTNATDGRRTVEWSCRWTVPPYRRVSCLNPHAHADGACRHEEQIIPAHVKGPPDKPLKTGERVNLWSHQPEER